MLKLLDPNAWCDALEPRLSDVGLPIALLTLAIVGAFLIATACEIGIRVFNTDWNYVLGYATQPNRSWTPFFGLWLALTLTPVLQGLVGAGLLKIYSRRPLWLPGVAGAVIGWIPMYVAAVALILLPGILIFAIAFVISCGWWAISGRWLLGLGYSESPEHVAVSLVLTGALMLLLPTFVGS